MKDETGESGPKHTGLEILHDKIGSFLKQPTVEQHITDALNPKATDSTILEQAFNLFGELEEQLYDQFGIEFTTQLIRSFALANDPLTKRLMDELSKHKDQFQHIFETERGSLYFVLPSGQSLRFQRQNSQEPEEFLGISLTPTTSRDEPNIKFYKMHEIADYCVFIPAGESARITRTREQEYRIRLRDGDIYRALNRADTLKALRKIAQIQTAQFGLDVSPVEFKLYPAFPPEQYLGRLKPDPNGIIDIASLFVPSTYDPEDLVEITNIHLGHPVTKIVYDRTTETLPPEPK